MRDPKAVPIRVAGPVLRWVLNRFGFAAMVVPWRRIVVLDEYKFEPWLIRHELAHIAQMDRDGWLTFWRQCLRWYFVPGYDKSPYEIEARTCEPGDRRHDLIAGYWVDWGV